MTDELTARDRFAIAALSGLLAAEATADGGGAFLMKNGNPQFTTDAEHFARAAYTLADAMLAARGESAVAVPAGPETLAESVERAR